MFEITDLKNKRFGDLSAGQKTRVFLSKAFLNFPKILLLDEPTASLDPEIATKVRAFLLKEKEKYNTSMLFTSHNMAEVEEMCDRVIFIDHGKIIAEDTPLGLSRKVKYSRVRFFIYKELDKALVICRQNGWENFVRENFLEIEIEEKNIPRLLSVIAESKILYSEISIEKPTLEDYFLEKIIK